MNSGTIKPSEPAPKCSSLPNLRNLAAGGGDDGVAGGDVPFAGRRQARIDIGAALGDPAEFDRRAQHTGRTAPGRAAMNASVLGFPWRAADRHDPGLPVAGQGGSRSARRRRHRPRRQPFAPCPTAPRQINPSAGAPTMPSSGTPSVTSARLTVNSAPAMNSLVPSSGSIRKKETAVCKELRQMGALLGQRRYLGDKPGQALRR